MDTNEDGKVTIEEWEAFNWANIIEGMKAGIAKERAEILQNVLGEWEIKGNSDSMGEMYIRHWWTGEVEVTADYLIIFKRLECDEEPINLESHRSNQEEPVSKVDTEKCIWYAEGTKMPRNEFERLKLTFSAS